MENDVINAVLSNLGKQKVLNKIKTKQKTDNLDEICKSIHNLSQKFDLTEKNIKIFYGLVADPLKRDKLNDVNELEGMMIKPLASKGLYFKWIDAEEVKKLEKLFKNKDFAAVATTENILKNILTMYRVDEKFNIVEKINEMKSEYAQNHEGKVLSNQEIGQLLNLDLDSFLEEENVKKMIPVEYKNLPDNLKLVVKYTHLQRAMASYCSKCNKSDADILCDDNSLNKFYYMSDSDDKRFLKKNINIYRKVSNSILKNIKQIREDIEKIKLQQLGEFNSVSIREYLAEKFGFCDPYSLEFVSEEEKNNNNNHNKIIELKDMKEARDKIKYGEIFCCGGALFKKVKKDKDKNYQFGDSNSKESMGSGIFETGISYPKEEFLKLVVEPCTNVLRLGDFYLKDGKLAAITFLEHPEKVSDINRKIAYDNEVKSFLNCFFYFMNKTSKEHYKNKKNEFVKALYSLPDTSKIKQEFTKSSECNTLIEEIVDYFKEGLDFNFILDYLQEDSNFDLDVFLKECFKDNDFREIVTNKLILKNILLASRAAGKHPLELIKSLKTDYRDNHNNDDMEHHGALELSNSEIKILLDFDFLNDDKCKKVIPIKTDDLSDEIKNDISGEYILNALKTYTNSENLFIQVHDYLNSNPDNRRVFYLLDGEALLLDEPVNVDNIKDKRKRNDFYSTLLDLTLENYSDIYKLLLKGNNLEVDPEEISNKIKNYILESEYKKIFTEMFKDEKVVINKEEAKEVNLIETLKFGKPYSNISGFCSLHVTNSKLAPIYVLQNPIKIISIKASIDKSQTTFDCNFFSSCLMDMISKQPSYKSRIPEILSYLDSESEMAKNIFSLAVEKQIYVKEKLEQEVLNIKKDKVKKLGIEENVNDLVLSRASFKDSDKDSNYDKEFIKMLISLDGNLIFLPAKYCNSKIIRNRDIFEELVKIDGYGQMSAKVKEHLKSDTGSIELKYLADEKPGILYEFIKNEIGNFKKELICSLASQTYIKNNEKLYDLINEHLKVKTEIIKNEELLYDFSKLKILSDKLFDTDQNSITKEVCKKFNKLEKRKLCEAAKKINGCFDTVINDCNDLKNKFMDIRDNYTIILKVLNRSREVKRFEVSDDEYKKLSPLEQAVIDQVIRIKNAIPFFEHADVSFEKTPNEKLSLKELIEGQKIKFEIDKVKIGDGECQKGEGNINEVLFTDDKKYVIKKDKFFAAGGQEGAAHRQNKEVGVYGDGSKKDEQYIADSVSRQMGEQTVAEDLGLGCVVKTKAALLTDNNGKEEMVTVMENGSLKTDNDEYVFQGAQVLLCFSEEELGDAKKSLNEYAEEHAKKSKLSKNEILNLYMPLLVTKTALIEFLGAGAVDYICGQVDRHSGNFFVHIGKDGSIKIKLIDNDRCFIVEIPMYLSKEYEDWLYEKVPFITTSLALRVMILVKDYKEKTERKLAGRIGKASWCDKLDSEKSKALLETEKRIILFYNRICNTKFSTMDQICNDARKRYDTVNSIYKGKNKDDKDFSLDYFNTYLNDVISYDTGADFFDEVNKSVFKSDKSDEIINDFTMVQDKSNLEKYANRFVNIKRKIRFNSPITFATRVGVSGAKNEYKKKLNPISAMYWKVRKDVMNKTKSDKQLIQNAKNKKPELENKNRNISIKNTGLDKINNLYKKFLNDNDCTKASSDTNVYRVFSNFNTVKTALENKIKGFDINSNCEEYKNSVEEIVSKFNSAVNSFECIFKTVSNIHKMRTGYNDKHLFSDLNKKFSLEADGKTENDKAFKLSEDKTEIVVNSDVLAAANKRLEDFEGLIKYISDSGKAQHLVDKFIENAKSNSDGDLENIKNNFDIVVKNMERCDRFEKMLVTIRDIFAVDNELLKSIVNSFVELVKSKRQSITSQFKVETEINAGIKEIENDFNNKINEQTDVLDSIKNVVKNYIDNRDNIEKLDKLADDIVAEIRKAAREEQEKRDKEKAENEKKQRIRTNKAILKDIIDNSLTVVPGESNEILKKASEKMIELAKSLANEANDDFDCDSYKNKLGVITGKFGDFRTKISNKLLVDAKNLYDKVIGCGNEYKAEAEKIFKLDDVTRKMLDNLDSIKPEDFGDNLANIDNLDFSNWFDSFDSGLKTINDGLDAIYKNYEKMLDDKAKEEKKKQEEEEESRKKAEEQAVERAKKAQEISDKNNKFNNLKLKFAILKGNYGNDTDFVNIIADAETKANEYFEGQGKDDNVESFDDKLSNFESNLNQDINALKWKKENEKKINDILSAFDDFCNSLVGNNSDLGEINDLINTAKGKKNTLGGNFELDKISDEINNIKQALNVDIGNARKKKEQELEIQAKEDIFNRFLSWQNGFVNEFSSEQFGQDEKNIVLNKLNVVVNEINSLKAESDPDTFRSSVAEKKIKTREEIIEAVNKLNLDEFSSWLNAEGQKGNTQKSVIAGFKDRIEKINNDYKSAGCLEYKNNIDVCKSEISLGVSTEINKNYAAQLEDKNSNKKMFDDFKLSTEKLDDFLKDSEKNKNDFDDLEKNLNLNPEVYNNKMEVLKNKYKQWILLLKNKEAAENNKNENLKKLDGFKDDLNKIKELYSESNNFKMFFDTAYAELESLKTDDDLIAQDVTVIESNISRIKSTLNINIKHTEENNETCNKKILDGFKKVLEPDKNIIIKFSNRIHDLENTNVLKRSDTETYKSKIEALNKAIKNLRAFNSFVTNLETELGKLVVDGLKNNHAENFSDMEKEETLDLSETDYDKKLSSIREELDKDIKEKKKWQDNKDKLDNLIKEIKTTIAGSDYADYLYDGKVFDKSLKILTDMLLKKDDQFENKYIEFDSDFKKIKNTIEETEKKNKEMLEAFLNKNNNYIYVSQEEPKILKPEFKNLDILKDRSNVIRSRQRFINDYEKLSKLIMDVISKDNIKQQEQEQKLLEFNKNKILDAVKLKYGQSDLGDDNNKKLQDLEAAVKNSDQSLDEFREQAEALENKIQEYKASKLEKNDWLAVRIEFDKSISDFKAGTLYSRYENCLSPGYEVDEKYKGLYEEYLSLVEMLDGGNSKFHDGFKNFKTKLKNILDEVSMTEQSNKTVLDNLLRNDTLAEMLNKQSVYVNMLKEDRCLRNQNEFDRVLNLIKEGISKEQASGSSNGQNNSDAFEKINVITDLNAKILDLKQKGSKLSEIGKKTLADLKTKQNDKNIDLNKLKELADAFINNKENFELDNKDKPDGDEQKIDDKLKDNELDDNIKKEILDMIVSGIEDKKERETFKKAFEELMKDDKAKKELLKSDELKKICDEEKKNIEDQQKQEEFKKAVADVLDKKPEEIEKMKPAEIIKLSFEASKKINSQKRGLGITSGVTGGLTLVSGTVTALAVFGPAALAGPLAPFVLAGIIVAASTGCVSLGTMFGYIFKNQKTKKLNDTVFNRLREQKGPKNSDINSMIKVIKNR